MKMPIKQFYTTCQTIAYIPTSAGKTNGKLHHLYEFNSSQNKLNASLHREEVAALITANLVGRIADPFQLYVRQPRMAEKPSGYYYSFIEFNRRTAAGPQHPRIHTSRCRRHVESTAASHSRRTQRC